jgi:hypothetical protein
MTFPSRYVKSGSWGNIMKSILCRLRAGCATALLMSSAAMAQDVQAEFDNQSGLRMICVDKALGKALDGMNVSFEEARLA